jgi:hypothetical protein
MAETTALAREAISNSSSACQAVVHSGLSSTPVTILMGHLSEIDSVCQICRRKGAHLVQTVQQDTTSSKHDGIE